MKEREIPVEVAGYENKLLPTLNASTGEINLRWWSINKGLFLHEQNDPEALMIPLWQ